MPKVNEKIRTDFRNVETNINHTAIPDERVIRPRVNRIDDINKLADQLKSSPTSIVNFFVDVGLECFERTLPMLKDEIKKTLDKKLKGLLK